MGDESTCDFHIEEIDFPQHVPEEVEKAYALLKVHHRPKYFNKEKYRYLILLARGDDETGYPERYLNFPEDQRSAAISISGYVTYKNRPIISSIGSKCLALDRSWKEKLRREGVDDRCIDFLSVESFIACPVEGHGVLMVNRNVTKGFCTTDYEFAVEVSGLLRRALDDLAVVKENQ